MKYGRTELLYLDDSYVKEFDAAVLEVGDGLVLDRTFYHPRGGGLESDTGTIIHSSGAAKVTHVLFRGEDVVHFVEGPLPQAGESVHCVLDWDKRYRIMRMHTGLHVLAATMVERAGALITGNNISYEFGRVDFSLEKFDRTMLEECVEAANVKLASNHPVRVYYMEREKVLSTPGLVKLAERLPPEIPLLRIVEIGDIDVQADGGPHVKNTAEVGRIVLLKMENKGKTNRRIYFTVTP